MTRTRRSVWAFISGFGGSGVTLAVGLISTPLLLRWLGDERVGTYRIAIEWLGYLALFDFGLGGALQMAIARRLGHDERPHALTDVRHAMRLFVRVGCFQLVAVAAFAGLVNAMIPDLSAGTLAELRWGLAVAGVGLLFTPLAAIRPLLDGAQQSYWVNLALLVQTLGTTGFALLFAWHGWGLVGQFAAALIGTFAFNAVLIVLIARLYPDLWRPRERIAADSFPVAWPMFVFNLVGRVGVLSDGIILGAIVGPTEVVRFYVTQRLMLVFITLAQGIGNATWAPLADLYHRGELGQFRRRFLQLNRWTAILAVAGLGPLAVLNGRLVLLWVGPTRYAGDALSGVTFLQAILMAQIAIWAWPLAGCGMVRKVLPVMIVGSALNLGVSTAGTFGFGLIGPAVGTVAGYLLVYSWWYPLLLAREFGLSPRAVMSAPVVAVGLFLPVGGSLWLAADIIPNDLTGSRMLNFLAWGSFAGLTGLAYLVLAWRVLTPSDERTALIRRVVTRK